MGLNQVPRQLKNEIKVLLIDEALKSLETGVCFGICYAIECAYLDYGRQNGYGLIYNFVDEILPELMEYQPESFVEAGEYWFPNNKEGLDARIKILNEIKTRLLNGTTT